ncbi:potassium efflux protein KefA [Actinobacillus ureae]|uniref:Transporter, small conductance mechanosensitive ion channel MscS family protein n=1 Tax=Actinobacillus ureae ATCC 25976 TaxID=887324 RepID=E8KHJ0_9PAST|nr:mechanosensitive channel MscK [Actinobacillus ureae]EFX91639.1 transporter, small conductance mechanosensitive ion channel MscS family protein [Actinobacillus ureae ATCC 25976]SUT86373.1 potassium efflux protein KefA [Actinobacillus ureae]SUU45692.1 potassium efflux protein KefA [Actinobacillus ureae]
MIKRLFNPFLFSLTLVLSSHALWAAELSTEKDIQTQIDETKKLEQNEVNKSLIKSLEDTQALLTQITQQKSDNSALEKEIKGAQAALQVSKTDIAKLQHTPQVTLESLAKYSLDELQNRLAAAQSSSQTVQQDLTTINGKLVAQNSAPTKAQTVLTTNATRKQEISTLLGNVNTSQTERAKLETELALLDLQNAYNQLLLRGSDELAALYNSQLEEKKLVQQNIQNELSQLQNAINTKLVEESKNKVEQAAQSQQEGTTSNTNPLIIKQLDLNTRISEELLKQTTDLTQLSQDNLRIKGVLDNLQQTQRNIEEQISSLQGTLVLSRIINKQRQSLPQDQMVKGLSKQIADLRVRVFDLTEFKDSISDPNVYIAKLEKDEKTELTAKEKDQLKNILAERSKILAEMIKSLNNQLNLSINIELNQQQVQTISDTLQKKLEQQSFWVKSNSPIDLDWFKSFLAVASFQLNDLAKKFDFSNWKDNIIPASIFEILLALGVFIISRRKEQIKQRLTQINNSMKTVATDSQWNTPLVIFWTLILCLPSTFIFLMVFILITYICFQDPTEVWPWGLRMSGYWLYFAFMVAMLRPNGIGYRHFNMPQKSNAVFRDILKRSVWVIGLMLNTAVFSNINEMGIAYDVLGQVFTIIVLISIIFIVAPGFRQAISTYQNVAADEESPRNLLLNIARTVLFLAPIALVVLIGLGYYYTSLIIIEHLVSTYFAVITWIILRNVFYRTFNVASRRLAFRRLQEKREQALAKVTNTEQQIVQSEGDISFELHDDTLAVSEIKDQMLKLTDLLLWASLFGLLYWVWSDLVTVAYYLNGVTLWQQETDTATGVVMESITLLNLLVAFGILFVTYVLIRNLSGLLEALVFSNLKLSQGTPYTVTTLLTYLLIVLGATLAFATLGMSWSKLQWLFTALSVGLGFGMQEIFANFVSGIIILFERPVRIGDMITIGTFNGTVSKIRIRATTLIDNDSKEVIVPNKAFITERIVNWALTTSMTRLVISVGVAYGSDLDLVKRLLLQAAEENPSVLKDPAPVAYFLAFGASTLDHELRVHVGQISDRMRTVDELNRRINQLFAEHNIEIAFNQLDIFIKDQATNEEVKWATEKFNDKN